MRVASRAPRARLPGCSPRWLGDLSQNRMDGAEPPRRQPEHDQPAEQQLDEIEHHRRQTERAHPAPPLVAPDSNPEHGHQHRANDRQNAMALFVGGVAGGWLLGAYGVPGIFYACALAGLAWLVFSRPRVETPT